MARVMCNHLPMSVGAFVGVGLGRGIVAFGGNFAKILGNGV